MSTRTTRLEGIEASRGAAAVLVVLLHVGTMMNNLYGSIPFAGLFVFGHAGVDFFFVLSGFIITYIHASDIGQTGRLAHFWRKRFWRIYPVYWVVSAGYLALLLYSPTAAREERDLLHVVASMLLWPEAASPILGVGWSLRHELLFYALFSIAILHRRIGLAILALWGVGIASNAVGVMTLGHPLFGGIADLIVFRTFNLGFFFGIGVALLVRRAPWRPELLVYAGLAVFLTVGLSEAYGPVILFEHPIRQIAYAASSAAMLYGAAILDRTGAWTVPRWAVALGSASYSIYLAHVPAGVILAELIKRSRAVLPLPADLAFVITAVGAVTAGLIVHRFAERPIMRYVAGQRRTAEARPGSGVTE